MKYSIFFTIGLLLISSCKETEKERASRLIAEWEGKEIVYPNDMRFVTLGNDTSYSSKSDYTIVSYVDSIGCTSCKLQLNKWKELISQLDTIKNSSVSVLLILSAKDQKDITYILKRDRFTHPVCFDENDSFNKLNHFPSDMMFQTFLLDKSNKVLAMGNPVHNPKVKELYLKIISGDKTIKQENAIETSAKADQTAIDMGSFDHRLEQEAIVMVTNTGNSPLVISDVTTSCGCIAVEYNKEPVSAGKSIKLYVKYKAERPEHFNKTLTVYCNIAEGALKIDVRGNAVEK